MKPSHIFRFLPQIAIIMQLAGCSSDTQEPPIIERKQDVYYGKQGAYHIVRVKSTQTVAEFAASHRLAADEVAKMNQLDPQAILMPGTMVKVPVSKLQHNQIIEEIRHNPETTTTSDAYEQTVSEGHPATEDFFDLHDIKKPEQSTAIAEGFMVAHPLGNKKFMWPASGRVISRFNKNQGGENEGVTLSLPVGSKVMAAADGIVVYSGPAEDYGNLLIIEHPGKVYTGYAYNSKLLVRKGQEVHGGQTVASSGAIDGQPQLFFSIRQGDIEIDPEKEI